MSSPARPLRITVTGASGFLGSALVRALREGGHTVVPLVRSANVPGAARWDPATGQLDEQALGAIDAIVHLAAENVVGRWTTAKKQKLRESRIGVTERLCRSLVALHPRPRVLVAASGTGFHGDCGDRLIDETSPAGSDFLGELAAAWEGATAPAAAAGLRVVNLRFGMVLDPGGGALQKMLPAFRLGLGGRLGSGRQWTPWISRRDAVAAIRFVIDHDALRGPVLAVAPEAVTNRDFTRALGKAL
ncbi:MAG: TIGR01777 family oxidoreductase, partial [Planctomycetes bacterium]|nr:TIGR01777 family oxidoreductase [Planctomycetota bacterium]